MFQVEICPADIEDVPEIALALSEATARKAEHGDFLWGDEPFSNEDVVRMLGAGGLYAITCDGLVTGTVTLAETDQRFWEDTDPNTALYIHKLATNNAARGNNVGARAIDKVAAMAKQQGRQTLRLDCSYANTQLCAYYDRLGFAEVARRDFPRQSNARDLRDPMYKAILLQRDV